MAKNRGLPLKTERSFIEIKPDIKSGFKTEGFRKVFICIFISFLVLILAVNPVYADMPTEGSENDASVTEGDRNLSEDNFGKIQVITIPNGSEIYINEKQVGKTPALIEEVPPGFYEVVLKQEGYDEAFARVYVKAGETASVSKKLRVNEWVYSISTSPSGADVYLDGKYKGATPVVFYVKEGQHKLAIKKPGYSTVSREFNASSEAVPFMEEKLHLSYFTYFIAINLLLFTGIIVKRNSAKLNLKSREKTPEGSRTLKHLQNEPLKEDEKKREEKKDEKFQGKLQEKMQEKLQEKIQETDELVKLENLSEPDFKYTVKKKN